MDNTTPTQLPIVEYENKRWYFDARLRQIRNVENPHDYQTLSDVEMRYFEGPGDPKRIVHIVWKDEGRDNEGRSIGRAYAENAAGEIVRNYGWTTWKVANDEATALGLELDEV
jgi:hypothetical protein